MGLEKEHIRKPYVQRTVVLDKRSINKYIRPEWHRDMRKNHINHIAVSLRNGEHFNENITVNEVNGKKRILNGNHRMQAVRSVIEKYPQFKIECTETIYKNLDLDEERSIYSIINRVKTETMNDYIKAHCFDSNIYKMVQERFPSTVGFYNVSRSSRNYIHFATLIRPYLSRNSTTSVVRGFPKDAFVEEIRKMDEDAYDRMAKFMRFFKRTFGEPGSGNIYAEYHKITSIAKIYYTETAAGIGEEYLEKRFTMIKKRMPQLFDRKLGNYSDQIFFYHDLVRALNMFKAGTRKEVVNLLEIGQKEGKPVY